MVSICILWLMVFKGAILFISSPIVFEDSIWLEYLSLPIRFEDISWLIWLVDISWPTMLFLEDMSRPIMFMEGKAAE